jgi:DNA repair protein RecN (Recombination protein N)
MLIELHAENIAIIERAEVRFGPGFTAITGETGAGKSLLIDAISLCLGERADTTLIRKDATSASVRAVFDAPAATRRLLDDLGYSIDEEALYLQRDLAAEGKSVCRINGKTAPLGILKQVGDSLADLHGQHEHQSLIHSVNHLQMLDDWTGVEAHEAKTTVQRHWEATAALRQEMELLRTGSAERERMLDVLRFQVHEIDNAAVTAGEIDELHSMLKRLQGAESLEDALAMSEDLLFAGELSARERIQSAIYSLSEAARYDVEMDGALAAIRAAELAMEEAISLTKAAKERVEYDPEKIELAAGRLDLYATLKRKYGETEEQILQFLESARTDLNRLEHAEELSSDIEERLMSAQRDYDDAARELSAIRREHAANFSERVEMELRELGMAQGRFECRLEAGPPGRNGADKFEFLFSANVGEGVQPLSKIASGGEMSRLMLAIRTVMAGKGGVSTLIFDEIDSGLGGQTAAVVARKLSALGQNYQVIAITHVAQIAGKATSQVSIEKTQKDNRTAVRVRELSPDERVGEIARMVGGEQLTDAALANAKQLLSD